MVEKISLVYSLDEYSLLKDDNETYILAEIVTKSAPGEQMTFTIDFPIYGQLMFLACYSFDKEGNRGRISNIETVYVPEPKTEAPAFLDALQLSSEDPSDKFIIIVIGSSLGGLFILSILSIIFFLSTSRAKGRQEP